MDWEESGGLWWHHFLVVGLDAQLVVDRIVRESKMREDTADPLWDYSDKGARESDLADLP